MRHVVAAPITVLEALERLHPDATRNRLRAMLDVGRVHVNGAVERRAKRALAVGDVVEVGGRAPTRPARGAVRVLHEDARVVAVEKPHGLLTVRTDKGTEDALFDRLFEREKGLRPDGRVFIVHRLDRPTSGVILFAKDEAAKDRLQAAFAAGEVERVYHVVVEGTPDPPVGTIDARLAESRSLQVYVTPSNKHGKRAVTHYEVLERGPGLSLLEVRLGTGKRHQIRVHMASIGHPVAGDREHGATGNPLRRLGLHAARLVFPHPDTGERVTVVSPTPRAFRSAVRTPVDSAPA